jgi:hypothetical protein
MDKQKIGFSYEIWVEAETENEAEAKIEGMLWDAVHSGKISEFNDS